MSKELISFLETTLKPHFCAASGTFDSAVQEEYVGSKGWLDKNHILKGLKLHLSTATFRKAVKQVFGVTEFNQEYIENEVTQEEFNKHYTFGKFTQTVSWIEFFYKKSGKVLTRAKLFTYILGSTTPNNGISFYAGGIHPYKEGEKYTTSHLFS